MPRIGRNPLLLAPAPYTIKPVVFVVVTHLPCSDDQYHAGRLEVIQACLNTMRQNAHQDHTFIVWDNGSKDELRDWIQHIFEPDIFIASQNIGKLNARKAALQMLSPASIVCYSDDDILYYDNWLKPQLDLLLNFPNVATVSGYPVRTQFRWGNANTLAWARQNAKVKQGQFIPKEWEDDFAVSIGRDPTQHAQMTLQDYDTKILYEGREAFATAHHCQHIGYAVKLLQAMHGDDRAMGEEREFDIELDKLGLRLCTTQRLARHMGNVLDDKLRAELNGKNKSVIHEAWCIGGDRGPCNCGALEKAAA